MAESRRVLLTTAVVFAVAVLSRPLVFAIPGYRSLVISLPETLQRLEQPTRWTILCLAGLYLGSRITPLRALAELGLRGSAVKGIGFGFVAALPMLLGPLVLGTFAPTDAVRGILFGTLVWPLAEEILYRGYAFGQLHRRGGMALWPAAAATGILFGIVHLGQASVRQLPLSGEIGTVALIAVGGVLYSWLYARWDFNLWVPFALHGFMNLWWGLFSMADNPLGGWLPNVMRASAVLLAIGLTLWRDKAPLLRPA